MLSCQAQSGPIQLQCQYQYVYNTVMPKITHTLMLEVSLSFVYVQVPSLLSYSASSFLLTSCLTWVSTVKGQINSSQTAAASF